MVARAIRKRLLSRSQTLATLTEPLVEPAGGCTVLSTRVTDGLAASGRTPRPFATFVPFTIHCNHKDQRRTPVLLWLPWPPVLPALPHTRTSLLLSGTVTTVQPMMRSFAMLLCLTALACSSNKDEVQPKGQAPAEAKGAGAVARDPAGRKERQRSGSHAPVQGPGSRP